MTFQPMPGPLSQLRDQRDSDRRQMNTTMRNDAVIVKPEAVATWPMRPGRCHDCSADGQHPAGPNTGRGERTMARHLGVARAVLLAACAMCSSPVALAQAARWEPNFRFPGTFFPAFAIAAAGRDAKGPTDSPGAYGYVDSGSLGVKVLEAAAGARLKVVVEIPEIGVSGEIESAAPVDGKPKFIVPRLSWSQARLSAIAQPLSTDAIFKVFVDGAPAGEERRPVRVRATNDAPLRVCRAADQCADYGPFFAAFVNENNPAIDGMLREALDIPALPVKSWNGTQGTQEDVLRQVWAIWYLLQRKKVTYSSITTVSDSRTDLFSQTVRPLSQTLRTSQANCIDGTALFASVLRKIGIEPIIVLIPGHAFLGFYTDPQRTKTAFLETTMVNGQNNPFYNHGPSKLGTSLARALGSDPNMNRSWQSFVAALEEGQAKYARAAANFGKQPGYMLIPVFKAREAGILPLPL